MREILAVSAGLLLVGSLACGSGGDGSPTEPEDTGPTLTTVEVTPRADTLEAVDETAQFDATAKDQNGQTMSGVSFTWSADPTSVATVDGEGLATAVGEGTAEIVATASGVSDTATLDVIFPPEGAPSISSVSPSPIPEGGSATISGSNFEAVPGNNTVTVDGVQATVTSASETSLEITVPTYDCLPPRDVVVEVTTSVASDQATESLTPDETAVSLAAGEQTLIQDPADFCFQFDAESGSEAYLLGVQSAGDVADALTPIRVTSEAADGSGSARVRDLAPTARAGRTRLGGAVPRAPERWREHRLAETRLRATERRILDGLGTPAGGGGYRIQRAIGSGLSVGDTVPVRVEDVSSSSPCTDYAVIGAEVKAVGTEAYVLADTANPSGGFTDADYQDLSDRLDTEIMATLVAYFGDPSDVDTNGRVAAVFTNEVNQASSSVLGFVFGGDLFDPSSCESSDEGEVYYGRVPDSSYPVEDARLDAPITMAHEITHIVQNRRLVDGFSSGQVDTWIAEGQATFAEEVVGHDVTGRSVASNYGYAVAFNDPQVDEIYWYRDGFIDLYHYYGFESSTSKVAGAPEECGWLVRDPSPCLGRPLWYGVGWAFLRWISDRYGPSYGGGGTPAGEQELHRDLIATDEDGFPLIETLVGRAKEELLAEWAATLYVDDRIASAPAALSMASWDLFNVFDENLAESARLVPLVVGFTDWEAAGSVKTASAGYVRIEGSGRPATAVRVRDDLGGTLPSSMQIWLVRLE